MMCQTCYRNIPAGETVCPACGTSPLPPPVQEGTEEKEVPKGVAWEEREKAGFFAALGETLQSSLFRPSEFFRNMPPRGKVGAALFYLVVVGTFSTATAMMWKGVMGFTPMEGHDFPGITEGMRQGWYLGLLFLPFILVVWTYFSSAVIHLSLRLFGGAGSGYAATLKAVAYSGSASAFHVFPFVGPPVAMVWRVVILVIGLREVHHTSTGRAFLGWFLPFFIVFIAVASVIAAVVAIGLATILASMEGLI